MSGCERATPFAFRSISFGPSLPDFARWPSVAAMSDRLAELARQRALVQEHLAWLDREIAAAKSNTAASASPLQPSLTNPTPTPTAASAPTSAATRPEISASDPIGGPAVPADPDAILAQYRVAPTAVKQDVRKGCFLYFAAALVLLAAGVTLLYFLLRSP